MDLQVGELVTLRNFTQRERRLDGASLSLQGEPPAGQPPLRVRWLGLAEPNGATGRVAATRRSLLAEFTAGMERYGLPDPLERLTALLDTPIAGTRSIIHGDLNLENVLVGPGDFVWLIDFAQTRDGHPLFDFAHLEAELIAQVIAPQISRPAGLPGHLLQGHPEPAYAHLAGLRSAIQEIAGRCLFNPSQPSEYSRASEHGLPGRTEVHQPGRPPEAPALPHRSLVANNVECLTPSPPRYAQRPQRFCKIFVAFVKLLCALC